MSQTLAQASAAVAQAAGLLSLLDQSSQSASQSQSPAALALVHDEVLHALQSTGLLASLARATHLTLNSASTGAKGKGKEAVEQIIPGSQSSASASASSTAAHLSAQASSLLVKYIKRSVACMQQQQQQASIGKKGLSDAQLEEEEERKTLTLSFGFELAVQLARQVGWAALSHSTTAQSWLAASFAVLASYVVPPPTASKDSSSHSAASSKPKSTRRTTLRLLQRAIELAGVEVLRFGSERALLAGGEFARTVINPNVPKFAQSLVAALGGAVASGDTHAVVSR